MEKWGLRYLGFVTLVPFLALPAFWCMSCNRNQPKSTTVNATATQPAAPKTFQQAVDQARVQNKDIYLKFSATWCGPCKVFEREVLDTAQAKVALKNVVYLPVDIDGNESLAQRFNVTGVPTGILVKPDKSEVKELNRHVGTLSLSEFIEFLSSKG